MSSLKGCFDAFIGTSFVLFVKLSTIILIIGYTYLFVTTIYDLNKFHVEY